MKESKSSEKKPEIYKFSNTKKAVLASKYNIDTSSISSIIRTICLKVLEKHFSQKIEEKDVISLSSGLIKLSISTFSIALLCDDIKKVEEYISFMNTNPSDEELVEFIKENDKYLDKDKYILNTTKLLFNMLNSAFDLDFDEINLKQIEQELAKKIYIQDEKDSFDEKQTMHELLKLYTSINFQKNMIIPDFELFFEYAKLGFTDSKEVFNNIKLKKDKNYQIFDKINEILKTSPLDGINSIFCGIESKDVINLFNSEEIGKHIIRCITFLNYYCKSCETLNLKDRKIYMEDLNMFLNYPEKLSDESIIPVIVEAIKKYSYYMDSDRLIDLVINVLEKKLEDEELQPEKIKEAIVKLTKLKKKNNNHQNHSNLIKRFVDNEYIPQKELTIIKNKLLNGEINVDSIDNRLFNLLNLTKTEIELIMDYSINNFIWGYKIVGYNSNTVINRYNSKCRFSFNDLIIELYRLNRLEDEDLIKLYNSKSISIEFFNKYSREILFTKNINISTIFNDYYNNKRAFKKDSINILKSEIIIEVYKNTIIKDEDSLDLCSKEFIDKCLDYIDGDEDIVYFYLKRLITLDVVADWCGEEIIKKLFNENKINIKEIEKLYNSKKISKECIEEIILSTNPSEDDLINYMYKNYFREETIIKIFLTKNIYSKEATKLRRLNIISKDTYLIIKNRDIKEMEARIGRSLKGITEIEDIQMPTIKGDTIALPKVKNKKELKSSKEDNYNFASIKSQKTLINPFKRIDFLKLLKCKSPAYINYDDEKNPFYHYNFYVIQDDYLGEEITNDAIIIAERIYNNRDTKKDFATDNATYVMRYEDYLTLQGKQKYLQLNNKKSVINEVPGAIYPINHRSGSWAMNLLKAIAKVKSGKSMEELTPNNRRYEIMNWLHTIYTDDELSDILDLIEEIDDYELHTFRPDRFGIFRSIHQDKEKIFTK